MVIFISVYKVKEMTQKELDVLVKMGVLYRWKNIPLQCHAVNVYTIEAKTENKQGDLVKDGGIHISGELCGCEKQDYIDAELERWWNYDISY